MRVRRSFVVLNFRLGRKDTAEASAALLQSTFASHNACTGREWIDEELSSLSQHQAKSYEDIQHKKQTVAACTESKQ